MQKKLLINTIFNTVIIIKLALKFDAKSIKWDNFSKKHHREKLYKQIEEIDWDNEYKINLIYSLQIIYQDLLQFY